MYVIGYDCVREIFMIFMPYHNPDNQFKIWFTQCSVMGQTLIDPSFVGICSDFLYDETMFIDDFFMWLAVDLDHVLGSALKLVRYDIGRNQFFELPVHDFILHSNFKMVSFHGSFGIMSYNFNLGRLYCIAMWSVDFRRCEPGSELMAQKN